MAFRDQSDHFLRALAAGSPIASPTAIVVAHPDDETVAIGGRLAWFADLTLIHITDGAPIDLADALRNGLADGGSYAQTRSRELERALTCLRISPNRRFHYDVRDQDAAYDAAALAGRLAADLAGCAAVLTHPYEGGHPDHDAASFAVQSACELLHRTGRTPPVRYEFASYHLCDGQLRAGAFWPHPDCPEVCVTLSLQAEARKQAALRCFATQAGVLAWFKTGCERYRRAPAYDFAKPPPPGEALYDRFGWRIRQSEWSACIARARATLQREAAA